MERNWKKGWLALLCATIVVQLYGTEACFKHEKTALLDFKHYFLLHSSIDDPLPSWVHDPRSDCCHWERLICDSASGHVIQLFLDQLLPIYSRDYYTRQYSISLNLSLFLPLQELRSLNLSGNHLSGLFLGEGYGTMSTFEMLETIDLSYSYFDTRASKPLGQLTSLENLILDLSYQADFENVLIYTQVDYVSVELETVINDLANLTNLKALTLSGNRINGSIPQGLCALKNLQKLDLSQNDLTGNVPLSVLANLTFLEYLSLSDNKFEGLFPLNILANHSNLKSFSIGRQKNNFLVDTENPSWVPSFQLQVLEMSNCRLNMGTKSIPSFLFYQHNLQHIDLSGNDLSGMFPNWLLFNNSKLEYVALDSNSLTGTLGLRNFAGEIPTLFWNVSSLSWLDLSNNNLDGEIPTLFWNMSSLSWLNLSYNNLAGEIPASLGNMSPILLDLSNNNLVGQIPTSLGNMLALTDLVLSNNNFAGQIPASLGNMSGLENLDFSSNNLAGEIPSSIGSMSSLQNLDLSNNQIGHGIPTSFGNMSADTINLSNNYLVGEIPDKLWTDYAQLSFLRVSYNSLSGQIFSRPLNFSPQVLLLDNNHFNGTLQYGLQTDVYALDISNNRFSGILPSWIGNVSSLEELSMSGNNFYGKTPKVLCKLDLVYLSLSHNSLSGSIPPCFNMTNLRSLHLRETNLVGSIPRVLLRSPNLLTLDLGGNKLSRSIPNWIHELQNLNVILLGGNNLQGQLSNQLCRLNKLRALDLSNNKLSGKLPTCLWNTSLKEGANLSSDYSYLYNHFIEALMLRTKTTMLSYQGKIIDNMTILDLSSNQFIGEIPWEIGDLDALLFLNLSHNHLMGYIPESLHKMKDLESLDLSCNNLSGQIPPQLQELQFLEFFNVSYNNLSGKAPDKGQFATFDENSYKGNTHLSWSIDNRGIANNSILPPKWSSDNDREGDESAIDAMAFVCSFAASYVTVLLALVTILWINPHWRAKWFHFIETCLYYCFYRFLKHAF